MIEIQTQVPLTVIMTAAYPSITERWLLFQVSQGEGEVRTWTSHQLVPFITICISWVKTCLTMFSFLLQKMEIEKHIVT